MTNLKSIVQRLFMCGVMFASACSMETIDVPAAEQAPTPDVGTVGQEWSSNGSYAWLMVNANGTVGATNFNSKGGTNTITKQGTGLYKVKFNKLPGRIWPMVTAFTTDFFGATPVATHCSVIDSGTYASTNPEVGVSCFGPNGFPLDAPFMLSATEQSPFEEGAQLIHRRGVANPAPVDVDTTPHPYTGTWFYDISTGVFDIYFLEYLTDTLEFGTATVAAFDTSNVRTYCKIAKVSREFAHLNAARVRVHCFNYDGQPANSGFVIRYSRYGVQAPWASGAYIFAHAATAVSEYTGDAQMSWSAAQNSGAPSPIAGRSALGRYYAKYDKIVLNNFANWHATAFGTDSAYCSVGYALQASNTTPIIAATYCFNPAGYAVDSKYTHTYQHNKQVWN